MTPSIADYFGTTPTPGSADTGKSVKESLSLRQRGEVIELCCQLAAALPRYDGRIKNGSDEPRLERKLRCGLDFDTYWDFCERIPSHHLFEDAVALFVGEDSVALSMISSSSSIVASPTWLAIRTISPSTVTGRVGLRDGCGRDDAVRPGVVRNVAILLTVGESPIRTRRRRRGRLRRRAHARRDGVAGPPSAR